MIYLKPVSQCHAQAIEYLGSGAMAWPRGGTGELIMCQDGARDLFYIK